MIIREIDTAGDWLFGKGRNDYLSGNDAVAQDIACRLRSFLGDCFFDINAGVDWFNLLGSKNELGLVLAIKAVICNTPYVSRLVDLTTSLSPERNLTLSYSVFTVFPGRIKRTLGVLLTQDGLVLTTQDGDPIGV